MEQNVFFFLSQISFDVVVVVDVIIDQSCQPDSSRKTEKSGPTSHLHFQADVNDDDDDGDDDDDDDGDVNVDDDH